MFFINKMAKHKCEDCGHVQENEGSCPTCNKPLRAMEGSDENPENSSEVQDQQDNEASASESDSDSGMGVTNGEGGSEEEEKEEEAQNPENAESSEEEQSM